MGLFSAAAPRLYRPPSCWHLSSVDLTFHCFERNWFFSIGPRPRFGLQCRSGPVVIFQLSLSLRGQFLEVALGHLDKLTLSDFDGLQSHREHIVSINRRGERWRETQHPSDCLI